MNELFNIEATKTQGAVNTFRSIGASNHSESERAALDLYCTEPQAVVDLLRREQFSNKVWECAAGLGHLSEKMKEMGYDVLSTDIVQRDYPLDRVQDFLFFDNCEETDRDIITNPPFNLSCEFIVRGFSLLRNGGKMAMFLPLRYLAGKTRKAMVFDNFPPKVVYVFASRMRSTGKNGDFDGNSTSAIDFAWFVWEKTKMNRYRKTKVEWI